MNDPKNCQICGFVDSLGVCETCPNDGEASWLALAPTAPITVAEVSNPEPPPGPELVTSPSAIPGKARRAAAK